jgi:hypothetical protein
MQLDVKVVKGHCPECGKDRKAFVRCEHTVHDHDDAVGTSSSDTGMILECCGCGRVYFRRDFWFSEWDTIGEHPVTGEPMLERGVETTYWPAPVNRSRPNWLAKIEGADRALAHLLQELYSALDHDGRVLAAIAARTVFDRASELLGIDPALTFQEKLTALGANGKIAIDEKSSLGVLVDAASAAAHRGWRPTPDELATMMNVLEAFLHRSFIIGEDISRLKAAVPPKPRRKKQTT